MILFRAVFLELVNPFLMTLSVMVGLLMMEKVYRLVNLVVDRQLNLSEVGLMLIYLLPQVLSITVPLAVVGAVFVTVIRQSTDSEVISLRATGRALWSYALPFVVFGAVMTAFTAFVTLWLQPTAGRLYTELQVEMVRWRAEKKLVPGELNFDFGDKVIRIGNRTEDGELLDVFIAGRRLGPSGSAIVATRGRIEVDDRDKRVVFHLRDGSVYSLQPDTGALRTMAFNSLRYALEYSPARTVDLNTARTLSTPELLGRARAPDATPFQYRGYMNEVMRRFASPWACLAFALAAIPMAIVDPRSGKRAGYLRAIFLVAAYFIVWGAFKDLVGGGKAAPYALFLPAVLIFLYGMLRLWQINADVESLWRAFRR